MRFRWRTKCGSLEPKLAKQPREMQKQIECRNDRTESKQASGLAAGSSVPHRGLRGLQLQQGFGHEALIDGKRESALAGLNSSQGPAGSNRRSNHGSDHGSDHGSNKQITKRKNPETHLVSSAPQEALHLHSPTANRE